MSVAYDAGALIAADRDDREFWTYHRRLLARGHRPVRTAPVVAQVSRDARQARLDRLIKACVVEPFAVDDPRPVGRLLAAAGASDVVDAHLVLIAEKRRARILTSDPGDLERLSAQLDCPVSIRRL